MKNQNFSVLPVVDPHTVLKNIAEQNNVALKHVFGKRIRGNFLIKIKDQVLKELGPENLRKYFNFYWSDVEMITGTGEAPEYDICRMIVGIHRAYSIFLSKQEIRENEKSERYREQLVSETIEKIGLRLYASVYFRRKILFSGEEFLYYPLPYELFAMAVKMGDLLKDGYDLDGWQLYYGILHNVLSALSLMEDNLLGGAYPLCRGAIEMYVKLLVLNRQPVLYADYEKFRMYEVEQSCCSQKYPEEFYELFNARSCQNVKSKADYLHFGWVDFIHEYHSIVKQIPYSVYGLIAFLKSKNEDKIPELEHLEFFYKSCHAYTHGSVQMAIYPLLHYFEISIMLYYVIRGTFLILCGEKSVDSKVDGNDVISMIDRDFRILWKQYIKRSTEKFEAFYD
ncbi:MAG: hypothetical protein HDQ95_04015 [Roseburia sp.]|nr:hypothetical protein [Roseburia sp.]